MFIVACRTSLCQWRPENQVQDHLGFGPEAAIQEVSIAAAKRRATTTYHRMRDSCCPWPVAKYSLVLVLPNPDTVSMCRSQCLCPREGAFHGCAEVRGRGVQGAGRDERDHHQRRRWHQPGADGRQRLPQAWRRAAPHSPGPCRRSQLGSVYLCSLFTLSYPQGSGLKNVSINLRSTTITSSLPFSLLLLAVFHREHCFSGDESLPGHQIS